MKRQMNQLVQVLAAFWMGVLFTQLAIDDSGEHLGAALMVGALGTAGFTAAHVIIGILDARKRARQPSGW